MTAVRLDIADHIATLTLDMPDRSANVLNDSLMLPFAEHLQNIISNTEIRGIIITSAKNTFLAGADLEKVHAITDPKDAENLAEVYKQFLRQLEKCGKPVVAALNGTALGGGLELALACHYRIAVNNPKAKFGLPEVKLGLLPGGGGTQRLPRLIGIQAALPLLLEGKEMNPTQAKQAGIIHAVAENAEDMFAQARAWIVANPKAIQPWDDKKFKWIGGDSKNPANVQLWAIAPAMLNNKTHGNYPAPLNILSCVFEGGLVDFDSGLKLESRYFANCVVSQVAKNMVGTFWFQLNKINAGNSRPSAPPPAKTHKVGILGAGMMGAGIAFVSAKVGIACVLLDRSLEEAARGKQYSENLLDKSLKRGKITQDKKQKHLDLIKITDNYEDLSDCDLIIEAVFENREIKKQVTENTEKYLPETSVFASNTSTLPITGLAKNSKRPANFVGLHFFSPVDKMPLVEIIRGAETSDETLAKAFDYVRQINKTPIVVNDSRGFFTSRVFGYYVNEGMALLQDGCHPQSIENAAAQAGFPVGPLAVHDEVSLELSLKILKQTRTDLAAEGKTLPEHPANAVLNKMVNDLGRIGKKASAGFYDYPAGGKKAIWGELTTHFPVKNTAPDLHTMKERLWFIHALETAKVFGENVLTQVADANIGSIFGIGFAPHTGGALQFINAYGVNNFVKRADELAEKYGERFAPCELLRQMAATNKNFV